MFLGSLFVRTLYVISFNVNRIAHGQNIYALKWDDQGTYWQYAEAILRDMSWLSAPVSSRPPFYPLVLALAARLIGPGENFVHLMLVQAVIGSLSVVIIYFIARHIFGRQTAIITSLWAAAYPLFVYYCGLLLSETLAIFLFLLFFFMFVTHLRERRRAPLVFASLVYVALIHTDPRFLFHLPFIFLYLFIATGDMKRAARAYLLFVIVAVLCSLPWAVRNHVAYTDRFVLINTTTLDIWTRSALTNTYESGGGMAKTGRAQLNTIEKFEEVKKKAIRLYREDDQGSEKGIPRMGRISSEEEARAFERGARPGFSAGDLYLHRFIEFWRFARFSPGYDPFPDLRFEAAWGLYRNLAGILFTGILLPLFLWGVVCCIRQRNTPGLVACAIVFVHTFLHVLVHARERYRMPVEALVAMIAFYGLLTITSKIGNRGHATLKEPAAPETER